MESTVRDLKQVARLPETATGRIAKGSAVTAVAAIRALQKIAHMPVGKNPLAEAQAMREAARVALGINAALTSTRAACGVAAQKSPTR